MHCGIFNSTLDLSSLDPNSILPSCEKQECLDITQCLRGQEYGKQQLRLGESEASACAQLRAAVTLRPEVVAPSRFSKEARTQNFKMRFPIGEY